MEPSKYFAAVLLDMKFGITVFYVQKLSSFFRSYTLTIHIILLVTTQGVTRILIKKKLVLHIFRYNFMHFPNEKFPTFAQSRNRTRDPLKERGSLCSTQLSQTKLNEK